MLIEIYIIISSILIVILFLLVFSITSKMLLIKEVVELMILKDVKFMKSKMSKNADKKQPKKKKETN